MGDSINWLSETMASSQQAWVAEGNSWIIGRTDYGVIWNTNIKEMCLFADNVFKVTNVAYAWW